jgi:DNA mismatch repair protein MutS2
VNAPTSEALTRDIKVVRVAPLSREPEKEEVYKTTSGREIAVGDKVKLKSFGSIGIVDAIKDGVAEVRVKSLRLREHVDNLQLVELAIPPNPKGDKLANLRRSSGVEIKVRSDDDAAGELNVIGKTTDEAIDAVDKFLDAASLASVSRIRIIHGHGTGALRKAISEMLKGHPHVERFAPAPQDQGGSGATLVELKQ